jgi:hypothetical protein
MQIEEGFSNPNGTVNRLSLTWLMSVIQHVPELANADLLEMYCGNGNARPIFRAYCLPYTHTLVLRIRTHPRASSLCVSHCGAPISSLDR